MSREVTVVRTGVANTASVLAGLRRVGAAPRLADRPAEIVSAGRVVLPGVGAFAAGMERLRDDHGRVALVFSLVQQEQALRVNRLGEELLPETRCFVHTGLDLIEVVRLVAVRRPRRADARECRHVSGVRQDDVIEGRENAAKAARRALELFDREVSTGCDESLRRPCAIPERLVQDLIHQ